MTLRISPKFVQRYTDTCPFQDGHIRIFSSPYGDMGSEVGYITANGEPYQADTNGIRLEQDPSDSYHYTGIGKGGFTAQGECVWFRWYGKNPNWFMDGLIGRDITMSDTFAHPNTVLASVPLDLYLPEFAVAIITEEELAASRQTDLKKLTALFTELGIGFVDASGSPRPPNHTFIQCNTGDPKIEGYTGFYTAFKFDENGAFIGMEVAE